MSATSVNTITVNLDTKLVTYSGDMTIREQVGVTLTGATDSTTAGIVLRVLKPDDHAEMAQCSAWTASGDDFVGTLDLSGADLATEFEDDDAMKFRAFILQVWNTTDKALILEDRVYIKNNPLTAAVQAEVLTPA